MYLEFISWNFVWMLGQNQHLTIKSKQVLYRFHDKYVVEPLSKDCKDIVFACTNYYDRFLIKEIVMSKNSSNPTYKNTSFDKEEIMANHKSVINSNKWGQWWHTYLIWDTIASHQYIQRKTYCQFFYLYNRWTVLLWHYFFLWSKIDYTHTITSEFT